MRVRTTIPLLALAAVLAACTAEAPKDAGTAPAAPGAATAPAGGSTGPAGEVAPGTRVPADVPATAKPRMPEGLDAEWEPYFEHIAFVFGTEAGLAKAAETGKPMMMFYAATW